MANWYYYSAAGGDAKGYGDVDRDDPTEADNWVDAFTSIATAASSIAAGDRLYVAHDSAELVAGAILIQFPGTLASPNEVLCVNRSTGALTTGATVAVNATSNGISIENFIYMHGLEFITAIGPYNSGIYLEQTSAGNEGLQVFKNCTFRMKATGSGTNFGIGFASRNSDNSIYVKLINPTFDFDYNDGLKISTASVEILGGSSTDNSSLAYPFIMASNNGRTGNLKVVGHDMSACTNITSIIDMPVTGGVKALFANCKSPSGVSYCDSTLKGGRDLVEFHNCTSSDTNFEYYSKSGAGIVDIETTKVLSSGASSAKLNGTTQDWSYILTTDNVSLYNQLFTPWIPVFVTSGSTVVSIKVAYDNASVLNDDDLVLEVQHLGTSGSSNATIETTQPEILTAPSSLTDSSEGWGGSWTNKKTYTLTKTVTVNEDGYLLARVGYNQTTPSSVYVNGKVEIT